MSSEIGYGAAAIRSGEARYQEKLLGLMKEAAARPKEDAATEESKRGQSKPSEKVGRNLDIEA